VRRSVLLALVTVALAGCGGGDDTATPAGEAPSAEAAVKELTNVLQLRSDFEADAGKARVILLFSPT
jgi:hypothetical protein